MRDLPKCRLIRTGIALGILLVSAILIVPFLRKGEEESQTMDSQKIPEEESYAASGPRHTTSEEIESDPGIPAESDRVRDRANPATLIVNGLTLGEQFNDLVTSIADPSSSYRDRLSSVQSLSQSFSPDEIVALYRFLLAAPPEGRNPRIHDRAIKNEILNVLRLLPDPAEDLTDTMIRMFEDPDQDEAVRDYALQHLRSWYRHSPVDERERILEALAKGMDEQGTSIAGTSLISLHSLENSHPEVDLANDLTAEAMRILYSDDAGIRSQVTAMQIAAERDATELHVVAAEWAVDAGAGYPRRLSGIAALGRTESSEAWRLLREIEQEGDEHLTPAIETAYRRLREAGVVPE